MQPYGTDSHSCETERFIPHCIVKDICKHYTKLVVRLQNLQPKRHRRRIKNLARPKCVVQKSRTINQCNGIRKTEIIREIPSLTRTEQLAYPRVRYVLPTREGFKKVLGARRLEVVDRTIKKSMLSLYSRLANYQPPERKCQTQKWTDKEWAVHRRYLSKLAKPKKIFRPPKEVHMWKDITIMHRYKDLCKPKIRLEDIPSKWELTPGLKKYKPTPIIAYLAKAREIDESRLQQTLPLKINPSALKYVPTKRIKDLATRAEVRMDKSDLKENPFVVAPNALKAKARARIVELAQPKEYEDSHTRQNPCLISPAALKAKPSARIIKLAEPKAIA